MSRCLFVRGANKFADVFDIVIAHIEAETV